MNNRKNVIIILSLLLLAMCLTLSYFAPWLYAQKPSAEKDSEIYLIVIVDKAELYHGNKVIAILEKETVVKKLKDEVPKYFLVEYGKLSGWIDKNSVRTTKEPPGKKSEPSQPTQPAQPVQSELKDLVSRATPGVVLIMIKDIKGTSTGSGFIVTKDGYILTNEHVVHNTERVTVMVNKEKGMIEYTGTIGAAEESTDLAIVKIDTQGEELTPLELGDSDLAQIGEEIFVMGYPESLKLSRLGASQEITVTTGIISSKKTIEGRSFLQTNAALNPGNSGGPVFLKGSGKVIGIITSKLYKSEGLGFAIPINKAKKILKEIIGFYGRTES